MNRKTFLKMVEVQAGRKGVKLEDRLYEDLALESIDMLHLVVTIEEVTGVFIPEEVIPSFKTLDDLFQYIFTQQAHE